MPSVSPETIRRTTETNMRVLLGQVDVRCHRVTLRAMVHQYLSASQGAAREQAWRQLIDYAPGMYTMGRLAHADAVEALCDLGRREGW